MPHCMSDIREGQVCQFINRQKILIDLGQSFFFKPMLQIEVKVRKNDWVTEFAKA